MHRVKKYTNHPCGLPQSMHCVPMFCNSPRPSIVILKIACFIPSFKCPTCKGIFVIYFENPLRQRHPYPHFFLVPPSSLFSGFPSKKEEKMQEYAIVEQKQWSKLHGGRTTQEGGVSMVVSIRYHFIASLCEICKKP